MVTPVTAGQKIFMSARFTHAEKAALRAALGRAEASGLTAEGRATLFASLEAGDFAASCKELGGCASGERIAPALVPRGAPAGEVGGIGAEGAALPSASQAAPSARGASVAAAPDVGGSRADAEGSVAGTAALRGDATRAERPAASASPGEMRGLERHPVAGPVDPGDVLVVDPEAGGALRRAAAQADRRVVGVAAGAAGEGGVFVALSGTALVKVDADFGAIAAGDLLVASPTPGHAMRASDPAAGTVLGKALEGLDGGRGEIRVLIMLR